MNFLKTLKCLLCLAKCSKYLYFAKKILCFSAVGIVAVSAAYALSRGKERCGKRV
ncbi:MAG: hypothetical protein PUC33_02280 [Oscillospiraceae bacterium]|nr:hypothetical protein [Oscillospiraceae bacterium]MDD6145737.1 hypothetical protein [Oscillospiraceae bacterium]